MTTPTPDILTGPDYFICDKLSCTMDIRHCIRNQDLAEKISQQIYYQDFISESRFLSCHKCEQGKSIKKDNHIKPIQPKPKPKTTKKQFNPPERKLKLRRGVSHVHFDWNALMKTDNARTRKRFRAVKDWLRWTYDQRGQNMIATAAYIGVSPDTLRVHFRRLGLFIRGRADNGKVKFLAIPPEEMANMTKLDISRRTGLDVKTIGVLVHRYGRKYQFSGTWRGKTHGH